MRNRILDGLFGLIVLAIFLSFVFSCSSSTDENEDSDGDTDTVAEADQDSHEEPLADGDEEAGNEEAETEIEIEEDPVEIEYIGCDGPVDLEDISSRQFTMAPYLVNPTTEGVSIQWEAMDNEVSYLFYGPKDHEYSTCICVSDPVKIPIDSEEIEEEHEGWLYRVTLTGLNSRSRYRYTLAGAEVPIPDSNSALMGNINYEPFGEAEFITAASKDDPFSMIILGDNQGIPLYHEKVVGAIVRHPADLLLHTGDIVHNGLIRQYRGSYLLLQTMVIRSTPHFHIAGNHEGEGEVIPFDTILPLPYLAEPVMVGDELVSPGPRTGIADYGSARFFVLDSERDMNAGSAQLVWLDGMLEETVKNHPEFKFLFTAWHRPTYSWSTSRFGGPKKALHEVVSNWRVDAVWNGHNHCYERFEQDGVAYIVTGGGGAVLTSVLASEPDEGDNRIVAEMSFHIVRGEFSENQAEFVAIRAEDDHEIDRFILQAKDRSDLR